jgi:predicted nucleotidyltransferase/DNA-binding XRE family transcriptional regulator
MSSGALIREARQRACLSQSDLARRAGVAQSVISAYESDHREPGMAMLTKLIEAAGHELVVEARPTVNLRRGLPDSRLGRLLRRNRKAVVDTLARRGAHHPMVFGSVARGEDGEASDIDLLVELEPGVGLVGLVGLTRELTELLGVAVDVVPYDALKPSLRDQAMAETIPL